MTGLDVFALIILLILLMVTVALWVALGMLPGRIARERQHPQAEAINMCGWWGAITLGILSPLDFIWAYTRPNAVLNVTEVNASPSASADDLTKDNLIIDNFTIKETDK